MAEKSILSHLRDARTLVFLCLLLAVFAIIHFSFRNIGFVIIADEGCYLKYGTYIGDHGIGGFKKLFELYTLDKGNFFPNPLRAGFILLSTFWLKAFGYSFLGLGYLSLFSFLVFLCISYYFASKFLDINLALAFTALLAFSPLSLAMARRAMVESTVYLFAALALWLFWGLLRERRAARYIGFVVVFSLAILMKETTILLSFFFVAFLLWHRFLFKQPIRVMDFLCVTIFPFIIVGVVYIGLGGLTLVLETIRIILHSPNTNPYPLNFGQGPWYRYIVDYMLLSPWVVVGTIGFVFFYLISNDRQEILDYFLVLFVTVFLLFSLFTKNVRYVMLLDIPMRLFTVCLLQRFVSKKGPRVAAFLLVLLVFFICASDYLNFRELFLEQGIYDPVSHSLLKAKHFTPF